MIKELPPDLEDQVEDFVRLLLEKKKKRSPKKPKFVWAGALKDLGEKMGSVEWQHKLSEMRNSKP